MRLHYKQFICLSLFLAVTQWTLGQINPRILVQVEDGGTASDYLLRANTCASGDCTAACGYSEYEYGFQSPNGFPYIAELTTGTETTYSSISFNPSSTGVFTLNEMRRLVEYFEDIIEGTEESPLAFCTNSSSNPEVNISSQVTVVNFKFTAVPNTCLTDSSFPLSPYISYFDSQVSFSGQGVTNGLFDPAAAGAGVHTITASRAFINSMSGGITTSTISIRVTDSNFNFTSPAVQCSADVLNLQSLTSKTTTFSGPGVSGSNFNAADAGPGTHTIEATFTSNGCTSKKAISINVTNTEFTFNLGTNSIQCKNGEILGLQPFTNKTTSFSGPGVSGTSFNPMNANYGNNSIKATFTEGACVSELTQIIFVENTSFIFSPVNNVCSDDATIDLQPFTDKTTTFSGQGVSGTLFDPASLGTGTYPITSSFTVGECTESKTLDIVVNSAFSIDAGENESICQNSGAVILVFAEPQNTPGNATWTSTNASLSAAIDGTSIDVSDVTPGIYPITLTYVADGGCTKTDTKEITVVAASSSSVIAVPDTPEIEIGNAVHIVSNIPETSTVIWFFGDGQISTELNPYHYYYDTGFFDLKVQVTTASCTEQFTFNKLVYVSGDLAEIILAFDTPVEDELYIFPNPVIDHFNINTKSIEGSVDLNVFDMSGKLLLTSYIARPAEFEEFDIHSFPPGMYVVEINNIILKMIKQ